MLLDRLDTFDFTAETGAPTPRASAPVRVGLFVTAAAAALAAYSALAGWIVTTNTARVYGFAMNHDPRTAIEVALQICPMLTAIFLVLLSPLTDRLAQNFARRRRLSPVLAILLVSAADAALVVAVTAGVIAYVSGPHPNLPAPITLVWVAGELMFDVALIGVFTAILYRLTRKLWSTVVFFVGYISVVTAAGSRWGITSYIGFGSTVPVTLTTYSAAPLYDGAGWLLRAYWTCVTLLLLSILFLFDASERPLLTSDWMVRVRSRAAATLTACLLMICVLAATAVFRLQKSANITDREPTADGLTAALQPEAPNARLRLTHFEVSLAYLPERQLVQVKGDLTFVNGQEPIRTVWFAAPALIRNDELHFVGAGPYEAQRFGGYLRVRFQDALPGGREIHAQQTGIIRRVNAFDLPVQTKVLDNAFFLTDADLFMAPRLPGCIASMQKDCGACENYLMSDRATGRIIVIAPEQFAVASAGEESNRDLSGGIVEHTFSISSPRLATFLIACAPFRRSSAVAKNGVRVQVFRSSPSDETSVAAQALAILDFYQTYWPPYSRADLSIVETPSPLGEALSYDGMVAISEKIINSRSPLSGEASGLQKFVMAHEVAHQWWGYRVVPSRAPGRMFVTESMAQFAAYQFLAARGILSKKQALQNERRRYLAARARMRGREVSLAESETGDEIAYNKGPWVLLSLDQLVNGSLMNRLGSLAATVAGSQTVAPGAFTASMINALPEQNRAAGRELIYRAGAR